MADLVSNTAAAPTLAIRSNAREVCSWVDCTCDGPRPVPGPIVENRPCIADSWPKQDRLVVEYDLARMERLNRHSIRRKPAMALTGAQPDEMPCDVKRYLVKELRSTISLKVVPEL